MIIPHPLFIVEHDGFRRYLNTLQLLFKVIYVNTIKSDIHKIYDIEKLKPMEMLDCISKVMWTYKQKKGYMVITTISLMIRGSYKVAL